MTDRQALLARADRMFEIAKADARRAREYLRQKRSKRIGRALAGCALQEALTLLVRAQAIRAGVVDDVLPFYVDDHLNAIASAALSHAMAQPCYRF